jgi:VWFA-related protein
MAAAVALALLGQQSVQQSAQQTAQQVGPQQQAALALPEAPQQQQQPQQPQQQQAIPDAPKPITQGLGPITPGAGTTPTSNGESGSSPSEPDPDQPAVGTSLPQSNQSRPMPDEEQTEAPLASDSTLLPTLRIRTNLVEIPFTVKDKKGKLVAGLTWRDVHVYENNVRQKMLVFTVDPHPLSVALVVDNSMNYDVMTRVNNSLGALQDAFTPYDSVALFTYNNGPKMVTDFTGGQSARLGAAIEKAKSSGREPVYADTSGPLAGGIRINGDAEQHENPLSYGGPGSPQGLSQVTVPRDVHTLNDAILMAAKATTKAGPGRRRIVYVISDGKEYGSTAKTKEVIKYLQTNKVQVIATLVGDSSVEGMGFIDTLHLPYMMRDNILPVYTKATGGEFYADYRTRGIETSFAKITADVRNQYTVWYNSREPLIDGKFRKVEVRVLRPNLQVIAKDGYYPSAQDAIRPPAPPATRTAGPQ